MHSVIIAAVFAVLKSFSDQMGYQRGFWYTFDDLDDKSDRYNLNLKISTSGLGETLRAFRTQIAWPERERYPALLDPCLTFATVVTDNESMT